MLIDVWLARRLVEGILVCRFTSVVVGLHFVVDHLIKLVVVLESLGVDGFRFFILYCDESIVLSLDRHKARRQSVVVFKVEIE